MRKSKAHATIEEKAQNKARKRKKIVYNSTSNKMALGVFAKHKSRFKLHVSTVFYMFWLRYISPCFSICCRFHSKLFDCCAWLRLFHDFFFSLCSSRLWPNEIPFYFVFILDIVRLAIHLLSLHFSLVFHFFVFFSAFFSIVVIHWANESHKIVIVTEKDTVGSWHFVSLLSQIITFSDDSKIVRFHSLFFALFHAFDYIRMVFNFQAIWCCWWLHWQFFFSS